jgi:hypothetical protein
MATAILSKTVIKNDIAQNDAYLGIRWCSGCDCLYGIRLHGPQRDATG